MWRRSHDNTMHAGFGWNWKDRSKICSEKSTNLPIVFNFQLTSRMFQDQAEMPSISDLVPYVEDDKIVFRCE